MSDATADTEALDAPDALAAQDKSNAEVQELRQEIAKLRREAAKYRSDEDPEHKALRNQLAIYQSQVDTADRAKSKLIQDHKDTVGELQSQLSERGLELLKLKAVLAEGIPAEDVLDVAALIQGDDEATVSDSVKRVKSLLDKAPTRERPVDPSQGSGNVLPLNGDPLLETVKRMVGA
jgi:chromosome segregation ATPase